MDDDWHVDALFALDDCGLVCVAVAAAFEHKKKIKSIRKSKRKFCLNHNLPADVEAVTIDAVAVAMDDDEVDAEISLAEVVVEIDNAFGLLLLKISILVRISNVELWLVYLPLWCNLFWLRLLWLLLNR